MTKLTRIQPLQLAEVQHSHGKADRTCFVVIYSSYENVPLVLCCTYLFLPGLLEPENSSALLVCDGETTVCVLALVIHITSVKTMWIYPVTYLVYKHRETLPFRSGYSHAILVFFLLESL